MSWEGMSGRTLANSVGTADLFNRPTGTYFASEIAGAEAPGYWQPSLRTSRFSEQVICALAKSWSAGLRRMISSLKGNQHD